MIQQLIFLEIVFDNNVRFTFGVNIYCQWFSFVNDVVFYGVFNHILQGHRSYLSIHEVIGYCNINIEAFTKSCFL